MKKKLAVLFSLVLLALVGLVARITYINATSGSKYRKQVLSQAQQKYENQTLPGREKHEWSWLKNNRRRPMNNDNSCG